MRSEPLPPLPNISAILLAAGRSRRMGRAKPFLELQSVTFVQVILARLRDAGFRDIVVVTNPAHAESYQRLNLDGARMIPNEAIEKGMLHSLKLGIRAVPETSHHALVTLVDMPSIRTSTFREAGDWALQEEDKIIRVCYQDRHGHPVVFPRRMFSEILEWDGQGGPREFVNEREDEVHDLLVSDGGAVRDYDTPEEYQNLRRETKS